MTVTRWLVTRSLPDPVVASEDPAYNTIITLFMVMHLVAVVVEHLEAEEHVADGRDAGLDARGASHRVEEVRHGVAVVLQISFYLA